MEFQMSDEAWKFILSNRGHINSLSNIADATATVSKNLGIADIHATFNSADRNYKNPLVKKKVEAAKGKVLFTLSIPSTDPGALEEIGKKLNSLPFCFTSDYYFLPRSGTAFVTIHFDEAAEKQNLEMSEDGSTYKVTVPVYASFSQGRLKDALKLGK